MKDKTIKIRLTGTEEAMLKEICEHDRTNMSEFLREAIRGDYEALYPQKYAELYPQKDSVPTKRSKTVPTKPSVPTKRSKTVPTKPSKTVPTKPSAVQPAVQKPSGGTQSAVQKKDTVPTPKEAVASPASKKLDLFAEAKRLLQSAEIRQEAIKYYKTKINTFGQTRDTRLFGQGKCGDKEYYIKEYLVDSGLVSDWKFFQHQVQPVPPTPPKIPMTAGV